MRKNYFPALLVCLLLFDCKKDMQPSTERASSTVDANEMNVYPGISVLFTSGDKTIDVLNANTGSIIFDYDKLFDHSSIRIAKAPLFEDSLMIIPAGNKLFCINYKSKTLLWETRFDVKEEPGRNYKNSELCMNSNTVFLAYADYQAPLGNTRHASKFFAVDIATGDIRWSIDLFQLGYDYDYFGNPACTEQTVYLPVRNKLLAYDIQSGNSIWQFAAGGSYPGNLSNPAYMDNRIFVACNGDGTGSKDSIFALDLNTGIKLWGQETDGLNNNPTPVTYNNRVFVNINTNMAPLFGGILCVEATTGNEVWKYTRPSSFPRANGMCPAFIENNILYTSEQGHTMVYALNVETGKQIWRSLITNISSTNQNEGPIVSDGMVYFKTTFSDMFNLDGLTGTQIWKTHIDAGQVSNPDFGPVLLNSNGTVIYSSESGMRQ